MKLILTRLIRAIGVAAMAGLLGGGAMVPDDGQQGKNRPPQTLPRGFESIDELQRDAQAALNAPALLRMARRKHPIRECAVRLIHARP